MEAFTNIDWHPSLNDIIDDEFINIDRLECESVMYNIIRGSYKDPFKNIHEDNYDLVTNEHINCAMKQAKDITAKSKTPTTSKLVADTVMKSSERPDYSESQCPKGTPYIPGVWKKPYRFPRLSSLTAEQHALCLRVILKFSRSEIPVAPTKRDMNELQTYMNLKSVIAKEQEEYLELAKNNWDGSKISIIREDLINSKWREKYKLLQNFHKTYDEVKTIAFNSEQKIHVNFISTVLEVGRIPKLQLPIAHNRNNVNPKSVLIRKKYFSNAELKRENYVHQDINCKNLAKEHNVDLVISTSGLKCLASNLNSNYNNTWILPVYIEEYNSKNIIFIDKPLPSTAKNIMEKNTWVYKYIIKNYLLRNDPESTIITNAENADSDVDETASSEIMKNTIERNHQYNLFTIGACGESQNELMKNKIQKDYKILVRTKIDAVEELENGMMGYVKLIPKLEHQTPLGCEAVTLDEAAKQWITLTFTPNAYVIRVRIDQPTSEYLQIEKRTTSSINNELNRLYNTKGENTLLLIYNIIECMKEMNPGRYLLRHTLRNGPFASLYLETNNPGKQSINLDVIYCENQLRTIPNTPWITLDKMTPTPASKFFKRMPVMFYPSKSVNQNPTKKIKRNRRKQSKSLNKFNSENADQV
ncbi:hypothetical protein PV327_001302 [Microctonus hyperodae]|uniref:Little elongation complex subunit 2 C-terminal domain-containing protein n=1 Tax=Microctonus hyperodae TaxID=165561 RepID=A0AA39G8E0_MICHY|nr:hypothetical protein PV327_001302 [Microctonus hyperodae]